MTSNMVKMSSYRDHGGTGDMILLHDRDLETIEALEKIMLYELCYGGQLINASAESITVETKILKTIDQTTVNGLPGAMAVFHDFFAHWVKVKEEFGITGMYDLIWEEFEGKSAHIITLAGPARMGQVQMMLALLSMAELGNLMKGMITLSMSEFLMLWKDLVSGDPDTVAVATELIEERM